MTLDPFLAAAPLIQAHALAATLAVVLGPLAIYRARRDALHKAVGYIWVVAMAGAALTSFGIHSFDLIGPFSPIHLLSVLALCSLGIGINAARRGEIVKHRETFRNLYWRGVMVAAVLNFLPERTVHKMTIGDGPDFSMALIGFGLGAIALGVVREWIRGGLTAREVGVPRAPRPRNPRAPSGRLGLKIDA